VRTLARAEGRRGDGEQFARLTQSLLESKPCARCRPPPIDIPKAVAPADYAEVLVVVKAVAEFK
jgi:hypothetical protein